MRGVFGMRISPRFSVGDSKDLRLFGHIPGYEYAPLVLNFHV
jgi:hypothetical protein